MSSAFVGKGDSSWLNSVGQRTLYRKRDLILNRVVMVNVQDFTTALITDVVVGVAFVVVGLPKLCVSYFFFRFCFIFCFCLFAMKTLLAHL